MKATLFSCLVWTAAIFQVVSGVTCPDQSECPADTTCCKTSSGGYGCCPIPNAVCCSDHIHCCPADTTCNLKQGTCQQQSGQSVPWLEKTEAAVPASQETSSDETASSEEGESSVLCPDQHSMCPEDTTCCLLPSKKYGCCPMPNAVCCQDHVHCCPQGSQCRPKLGECLHGPTNTSSPLRKKRPAMRRSLPNKLCPDGASQCPDGSTCCKLSGSGYGCCPIPNAVCCSDHIHCCPADTTCDLKQGTCQQKNGNSILWFKKESATPIHRPLNLMGMKVRKNCGTRGRTCSEEGTCCSGAKRGSECCPHVNGVCCEDGRHCCPTAMRCDTKTGECKSDLFSVPWTASQASEAERPPRMTCPDGGPCDKGNTCCSNPTGHHFSCCPIKNAVCCGAHCCPPGYYCGQTPGSCHKLMRKTVLTEFPPRPQTQDSIEDDDFFL